MLSIEIIVYCLLLILWWARRVASYLEFEGGNCSCGLGPVSPRFVQSLGSGHMPGPWIHESTGFSENLMTRFLPFCHVCEMDVGYLE